MARVGFLSAVLGLDEHRPELIPSLGGVEEAF